MTKLENYYFMDNNREFVLLPPLTGEYCVIGVVLDEKKNERVVIATSKIEKIVDNVAYTETGLIYELGKMHKDYAEILKVREEGIKVITSWSLNGRRNFGYLLKGLVDGREVKGAVTAQEGNYVVLNEKDKYYVIWNNLELKPNEKLSLLFTGYYCDLKTRDFSEFLGKMCRPNLVN